MSKTLIVGTIVGCESSVSRAGTKRYQVTVRTKATPYSGEPEKFNLDVDKELFDHVWSESGKSNLLQIELRLVERPMSDQNAADLQAQLESTERLLAQALAERDALVKAFESFLSVAETQLEPTMFGAEIVELWRAALSLSLIPSKAGVK